MNVRPKYLFVLFIVLSFGIATIINDGNQDSVSESKAQSAVHETTNCVRLAAEKKRLDSEVARLVDSGFRLNQSFLRGEISDAISDGEVTFEEKSILEKYQVFDLQKIVEKNSPDMDKLISEGLLNVSKVESILEAMLNRGTLRPYWSEEVQNIGARIAFVSAQSKELVNKNEPCFELEARVNRIMDEVLKDSNLDDLTSTWMSKRKASDLRDTLGN